MKKIFVKTAMLLAFCVVTPQLSMDVVKADNALAIDNYNAAPSTGTIVGVNLFNFSGRYLILDDSGSIYSYDFAGQPDLKINDRVIYSVDNTCSRIIVRPVIRK